MDDGEAIMVRDYVFLLSDCQVKQYEVENNHSNIPFWTRTVVNQSNGCVRCAVMSDEFMLRQMSDDKVAVRPAIYLKLVGSIFSGGYGSYRMPLKINRNPRGFAKYVLSVQGLDIAVNIVEYGEF